MVKINFLQVTFLHLLSSKAPPYPFPYQPPTKSGKECIMLFTKNFMLTALGLSEHCLISSAEPQDQDAVGQSKLPSPHDQLIPFGSLHLNPHWRIQRL